MNEQERNQLLAAYFAGELNESERARLLAELRADSGFAHNAAELLVLERLLKSELAGSDSGTFAREVVERLKAGPPRRAFAANVIARIKVRKRLRKLQKTNTPAVVWGSLRWAELAAAIVMLVLGGALILRHNSGGDPVRGQRIVAADAPPAGDSLRGKRLVAADAPLTQDLDGYCQLTLEPNSSLVINGGPRARKAALEQGSVACEVKKNAGTFAVESKLGTIAVRGTKFKVSLNGEKEGEAVWGCLAVKVFDGAVLFSTPSGTNAVLSMEKDWPREGGVLTGILTDKYDNMRSACVKVIADEEEENVKYLPLEVNGGFDKAMLNTFKHLYIRNRVKLVWVFSEPRRVLAIELLTPKTNSGTVTGTIIRKSEGWVDVKPKDGPADRYSLPYSNSKKAPVANLNEVQKGDTVALDWSFLPGECKRIEKIEKAGR